VITTRAREKMQAELPTVSPAAFLLVGQLVLWGCGGSFACHRWGKLTPGEVVSLLNFSISQCSAPVRREGFSLMGFHCLARSLKGWQ
jgi:hypothetical protein